MGAALVQLTPVQEMAPGAVAAIRNQVIKALQDKASSEMSLRPEDLVVRDIRPIDDLSWCATAGTEATENDWKFTGSAANTWDNITVANESMADERYIAVYGLRDMWYRSNFTGTTVGPVPTIGLVRISVGGADKVIWDISPAECYAPHVAGVCSSAIIIPQNVTYQFAVYSNNTNAMYMALMGFVCEPKGKVIMP